jgi:hypothetical protein
LASILDVRPAPGAAPHPRRTRTAASAAAATALLPDCALASPGTCADAFGSATYMLPVPELMGVRLTRQLTAFLRPLDTPVLLKGHMGHALRALRNRADDLMRLMEVFLSEPIIDWEAQTRR